MNFRFIDNLFLLCEMAGFKTPAEAYSYMQKEGIDCKRLYNELDALCFPEYITAYSEV